MFVTVGLRDLCKLARCRIHPHKQQHWLLFLNVSIFVFIQVLAPLSATLTSPHSTASPTQCTWSSAPTFCPSTVTCRTERTGASPSRFVTGTARPCIHTADGSCSWMSPGNRSWFSTSMMTPRNQLRSLKPNMAAPQALQETTPQKRWKSNSWVIATSSFTSTYRYVAFYFLNGVKVAVTLYNIKHTTQQ